MKPIASRAFGSKAGNAPRIAVKFYNGSSVVTGWVTKQIGTARFIVTNGTTTKVARLALTATEVTALTAGTGPDAALRADLCTIEVTPHGGGLTNVKSLSARHVVTVGGVRLKFALGVATAATGEGAVALVANTAPTVATPIPDAAFTAAAGWTYTFPANTFADVNADTLTYTATRGDNSPLPAQIVFNATTRTFTVAAASGLAAATYAIKVTANDGTATVSDTFDAVVS